jgi:predicted PurR-regulated permease PerM
MVPMSPPVSGLAGEATANVLAGTLKDSTVTLAHPAFDKTRASQALEVSIHIGLAFLLVAACLLILLPFIPLIAWGIIIAVAAYPGFERLQKLMGGRGVLAAVLFTLTLLAVLILPVYLLADSLIGGVQAVTAHVKSGAAIVPPPPPGIAGWPLIGAPLAKMWFLASRDLTALLTEFAPQIKGVLPGVLSATAGLGATVLQLLLSIVVSGVILANAQAAYELTRSLANRLFGERGPEFQELVGSTIRSVTFGIIGVAFIQSASATLGFLVVGLPAVGLWAVIFLIAAVLQFGAVVLVPAVIYVFVTASTTKAVIFLIWCVIVALMDNVLKPILLGRGAAVPIAVVFLGAIGGFVAMGIIGLFVGAIVLSVGYKLFLAWLGGNSAKDAESLATGA